MLFGHAVGNCLPIKIYLSKAFTVIKTGVPAQREILSTNVKIYNDFSNTFTFI